MTISNTIIIITIIITIIIVIIDHVCYKTGFGGELISLLFKWHCLALLIISDLIGMPYYFLFVYIIFFYYLLLFKIFFMC